MSLDNHNNGLYRKENKSDEIRSILFLAIEENDLKTARRLIPSKFDANVVDFEGNPALLVAVANRNLEMIELLCSLGACTDGINKITGNRAISYAITQNDAESIHLLCKFGANVHYIDKFGHNTAMMALCKNKFDAMCALHKCGADISTSGELPSAPLTHVAIGFTNLKILRYLCTSLPKKELEAANLLIVAIMYNKSSVIKILVREFGLPITGMCFVYAAKRSNKRMLRLLRYELGGDINAALGGTGPNCHETALFHCIQFYDTERIKFFVNNLGADVNFITSEGETCLTHAIALKDFEMVKLLVEELHADVNIGCEHGITAINIAAKVGDSEILLYLQQKGAKCKKSSLFEWSVESRNTHTIKKMYHLLKLNPQTKAVQSLLLSSVGLGNLRIVKFFVQELGVDIDLEDEMGRTALYFAITGGYMKLTKWLVRHGATIRKKGQDGDSSVTPSDTNAYKDYKDLQNCPSNIREYLQSRHVCANTTCGKAAKPKCSWCFQARYCGVECQTSHWKTHHRSECTRSYFNCSKKEKET